jgi:hypothetical protein
MFRLFLRTVGICLLIALTSCGRFDVKMDLPHYSMGPVKSSDFPTLVQEALTVGDQAALIFGKASWYGFSGSPGFSATSPYFRGVAALTETEIVLLLWNEVEETYEIVSQVPYANLNLVSKGRKLYFKSKEFSFGQETFTAHMATYFRFVKPSGVIDKAKTEEAFLVLDAKVEPRSYSERRINTSFDGEY